MNLAIGTVHKYDVQPCIRQSSYRSQAPRNCMPYRWLYFRGSIGLGVSFGGIVSNSPIVHRGDRWPIPILAPSRVPAKSRGSHLNFVDRSTLRTQHTAHGNAAAHGPPKHLNHDSIEDTYCRHTVLLSRCRRYGQRRARLIWSCFPLVLHFRNCEMIHVAKPLPRVGPD